MGWVTVSLPGHWVVEPGGSGTRENPRGIAIVIGMIVSSLLAAPDYPRLHWQLEAISSTGKKKASSEIPCAWDVAQ